LKLDIETQRALLGWRYSNYVSFCKSSGKEPMDLLNFIRCEQLEDDELEKLYNSQRGD